MKNLTILSGFDTEAMTRMVNKSALTPIKLEDVTVVKGNLSNDQPDSYKTIMGKSTLDNYARKINEEGLPLMVAHEHKTLPKGRVFQAEVKNNVLETMFFIPNAGNENIVRDIGMGVITDLSVGFALDDNSDVTCSKCSKSIRHSECRHVIGKKYEGKTVYGVIENAHANEASLVYKGSNSSTQIVGIVRMHNEGISNMDWEATFTRIGLKPDKVDFSDDDNISFLADKVVELTRQLGEVSNLAEVGKQYRTDLIEQAKQARIQAFGTDGWSVESFVRMLASADIETIKSESELYRSAAVKALNGGERPTETIRKFMVEKGEKAGELKSDDKPKTVFDSRDVVYK